ncbi:Xaa-Pro dipeptidyl-peptidase [Lacticaseibacillus saniviri]
MKLNQFARLTPDLETQRQELAAIGLLGQSKNDFTRCLQIVYPKLFPEAYSPAAQQQALATVAVNEEQDLKQWLQTNPTRMTQVEFYTVALQLLGFEADTTVDLAEPIAFMEQVKLPHLDRDIETTNDFVEAIYLLLNTRTPKLVNYLDDLANRGFFKHFHKKPNFLIFNGKVQQTFNPDEVLREVVWIESDLDTDHDGKRDLLEATIFRPAVTGVGLKVPALFTANPYFHGTNDQPDLTHDAQSGLTVKTTSHTREEVTYTPDAPLDLPHQEVTGSSQRAEVYGDENGIYSLNDYFMARGFAVVYSGGVGTRGSDGFRSTGGVDETASAVAVIEWLTGQREAFTNRTDGITIDAWWCNGSVAMTGKSYLGTLAIAAATSGVKGLKTIISEAAISSWYDYYRENGLVVAPGGFQGEDADVLAEETFSRQKQGGDYLKVKAAWQKHLAAITANQDRETGDYSAWWDERNYRNNLSHITADIVSVHGLNDWNVKPKNVIKFWEGIQNLPVAKKLFLHQGQHVYLNNILSLDFTDMMNLWLTHELLGVDNHAETLLPDVTIQDNVTAETWHTVTNFGENNPAVTTQPIPLTQLNPSADHFTDHAKATYIANHDDPDRFEAAIIQPDSDYAESRLLLTQPTATTDLTLEGTPSIDLHLSIDQPTGILSVRLVDLGPANRFNPTPTVLERNGYQLAYDFKTDNRLEFTPSKTMTAAKLISFGHINLQNQQSSYQSSVIEPGVAFDIHLELQPTHYTIPAGRQLGLIIHGADMAQTIQPDQPVTYTIDWTKSQLNLPHY